MEQEIIFFLVALTASLAIFGLGILIGRRVETSSDMIPNEQHFQNIIEVAPVGIRIMWERRFAFFNDIYFWMLGNESSNEVVGRFVEECMLKKREGAKVNKNHGYHCRVLFLVCVSGAFTRFTDWLKQ